MINKFGFYKQQTEPIPPPPSTPPEPQSHPSPSSSLKEPPPQIISSKPTEKRTYLKPEQYHPFQIPPNLQLAQLHRRATQFGIVSTANILQSQSDLACNCCGQHEKQLIPVCSQSKRIYRVSEAQGFYFTYIKVIIVALLCIFALQGLYTLITTVSYCSSKDGICLYVYGMPFPQDLAFFNTAHIVLGIVSAFLLYPCVLYLFYLRASMHERLKQSVIKISDYSLLISGADPLKISDRQLVSGLHGHSIETILFTHRIGKHLVAMQKRYLLQAKKNLYFKRGLEQKYEKTVREIYDISNIVLPFKNAINIGKERDLRTDKIIVKFRTVEDRQSFFKKYHVNLCTRGYNFVVNSSPFHIKGVPLHVQSLGEPEEMMWENLQVSVGYKLLMMAINTFVSAIILGGSFAIILMLTRQQNAGEASNEIGTSFLMALLIELVNVVLYLAIFQLTEAECRITLTGKMMARITRNVFVFFFNTTLIPFFLFLLGWIDNDRKLVYQYIVSLFFVTNLISPLSPIFNPLHLYKLYCRNKIKKQGKDSLFTQLQTNQAFQKNDFQLELKYQLLCQRIMNCCFYAAVFPEVLLFTIVGLALDYWIEKWWLLKHCCIPKFSGRLASVINRVSIFFPTVYLFGYLANLLMMRNQHSLFDTDSDPIIIICFIFFSLVISLLMIVFANKIVEGWVKGKQQLMQQGSSVSIKQLDYCDLNPTSFLHIDLKNTVDITLENRNRVVARDDNFERIERFVLKQQTEALKRRDSEVAIKISLMKDVE